MINTSRLIVSKTDLNGKIVSANEAFCEVSGFSKEDLLGKDHSIVRHSDMPSIVFKLLWVKLFDGQEVVAFVKNRRKNGDYYWVYATITPRFNKKGEISSFTSVRKRANPRAIKLIEPLYAKLLALETPGNYGKSALKLKELLDTKVIKYNALVSSLQINRNI